MSENEVGGWSAVLTCPHCGRSNCVPDDAGVARMPGLRRAWCQNPLPPAGEGSVPSADLPYAQPLSGPRIVPPFRPWGGGATLGWTLLCITVFVAVSVALSFMFMAFELARDSEANIERIADGLATNGLFLALSVLVGGPCCIGLMVLLARARHASAHAYLALRIPRAGQMIQWLLILGLFLAAMDLLTFLSGRPVVPPMMVEVYTNAGFFPLVVVAVLLVAPLWEELLFRGFFFIGIAVSRMGPTWAIMIGAALWSVLHIGEYGWFYIGVIFLQGLLLGLARLATGSTLMTIIMHAVANLVATVELIIQVEFMS
jgi:membrane protease YdiL (CAAX protease family)